MYTVYYLQTKTLKEIARGRGGHHLTHISY